MSIIRNRELSQFGSFIYIDNDSQKIGIATEATPFVGIGTANPTVKFHVVGDTNIDGNLNITNGNIESPSYTLNGNPLVDATILQWSYASNGTDIYRLQGNVGIGTSVFTEILTVNGNVSAGQFISTVTETSPLVVSSTSQVFNLNASLLAGKTPPTGDIVGTTDTQTLTNKTLTSPTISFILNGGTLTLPTGDGTLIRTGSVGLVTSGMISDLSLVNADIANNAGIVYSKLNLSNSILATDIVVGAGITYGKLSLSNSITNADIATSAGISVSKLSANTISGITLGNNLATLTFGTYLTGTSYNGNTARTIGINASTSGISNIVARDGSGNFSAGTITASSFVGPLTGTATGLSGTPNITAGIITGTFSGNGTIPLGGIIMWSGSIVSIPTGWALCNGSNGTPNLQDKFIVGAGSGYAVAATGGSANATLVSHSHTASTNTAGTHAHRLLVAQNSTGNTNRIDTNNVGVAGEGGPTTYVLNNNNEVGQQMIESAGSHSHTVTVSTEGSSATNANLPPYYALAFIMRTS